MSEQAEAAFLQGAGFASINLNLWLAITALAIICLWVVWAMFGLFKSYTRGELTIYEFTSWGFSSLALTVFLFLILV